MVLKPRQRLEFSWYVNDFSLDAMYRKHQMSYHPGALKYFQDHKIEAKAY